MMGRIRGRPATLTGMSAVLRMATPDDAGAILAIYAPVVRETPISFELEPPKPEEIHRRIAGVLGFAPWLVCEIDGTVAGYAYASRFRDRAAYQWSVETTVYVDEGFRRRGVSGALYGALFQCLRLQGFRTAVAGITLPNEASVRAHEAAGFRPAGVVHRVGFKFGSWWDVGFWDLDLTPPAADQLPAPPIAPAEASKNAAWSAALREFAAMVRAPDGRGP